MVGAKARRAMVSAEATLQRLFQSSLTFCGHWLPGHVAWCAGCGRRIGLFLVVARTSTVLVAITRTDGLLDGVVCTDRLDILSLSTLCLLPRRSDIFRDGIFIRTFDLVQLEVVPLEVLGVVRIVVRLVTYMLLLVDHAQCLCMMLLDHVLDVGLERVRRHVALRASQ